MSKTKVRKVRCEPVLQLPVLSHSGKTKRLYLTEDGEEREPGTEIRVMDAKGKPVVGLPGKDGYFEIKLPKLLLQSKTLATGWIDFYRR
jgi:hypothetical protein